MSPTPEEHTRRLHEEAEARTAQAVEEMVGRESFGELLAKVTAMSRPSRVMSGRPAKRRLRTTRSEVSLPMRVSGTAVAHGGQARAGASRARGRA
jgi:hypothetical protein